MNPYNAALQAPVKHQGAKRYGLFAARIGSDQYHAFRVPFPIVFRNGEPTGNTVKAGVKVYSIVQDITRHPEVRDHVKWHCRYCRQEWASKEEMQAAHPDNKVLSKQEEAHMYYAVAEVPAIAAQAAKHDEKGRVTQAAIEAKPSIAMLLSDEE